MELRLWYGIGPGLCPSVSLGDRIQLARRLRAEGRLYGVIGRTEGVSRTTAFNFVNRSPTGIIELTGPSKEPVITALGCAAI